MSAAAAWTVLHGQVPDAYTGNIYANRQGACISFVNAAGMESPCVQFTQTCTTTTAASTSSAIVDCIVGGPSPTLTAIDHFIAERPRMARPIPPGLRGPAPIAYTLPLLELLLAAVLVIAWIRRRAETPAR